MLSIFTKLLSEHEVMLEDFCDQHMELQGGGTTLANKPPGHTLLIHMLNDSSTHRMVSRYLKE